MIYRNKKFKNKTNWNDINSNWMYLDVLEIEKFQSVKVGVKERCYWSWYFELPLWESCASKYTTTR